jgi:hypothetical protein
MLPVLDLIQFGDRPARACGVAALAWRVGKWFPELQLGIIASRFMTPKNFNSARTMILVPLFVHGAHQSRSSHP